MCLGVPGRILDRWQEPDGPLLAHVDFVGEVRVVRLSYQPDLNVGDYTIVHAGYALTRVSEEEAEKTIALMREVELLEPAPADAPVSPSAAQQATK